MGLFAFDIDNTLLPFGSTTIPKKEIAALSLLLKKGNIVAIASGRPFESIRNFLSELGPGKKFAIAANGAAIYDEQGSLLFSNFLALSDARYFQKKYASIKGAAIYAYDNQGRLLIFKRNPLTFIETKISHLQPLYCPTAKELSDTTLKILKIIIVTSQKDSQQISLTSDEKSHYSAAHSNPYYFEIMNRSVNKGMGVKKISQSLNISKNEVWCFGDNENDVEMLKDFQGIAMGNATESCKKVARYVTKDCRDDGVAYALKEIIKAI